MTDLDVVTAVLRAVLVLIDKCSTLDELREAVQRMLTDHGKKG